MSGNPDQLPPYLAGRATTLIIFLSSCSPGYNEKKNHYMCSDEATSLLVLNEIERYCDEMMREKFLHNMPFKKQCIKLSI